MTILHDLNHGRGYHLGCRLAPEELATARRIITDHYLERLNQLAPHLVATAASLGIENYHRLPISFDHAGAWPKETRLLRPCHLDTVQAMGFFGRIERELGPVRISHDELNWRLVRPGRPSDVGPIHLDKWFWNAGYGTMPPGYDRFKIWIPIITEPGVNGLLVKPFSQKTTDWKHHFELRDGIRKPVLDEREEELDLHLLPLAPGQMVLFHDDLLHGGAVNNGEMCRVSLELTILYREDLNSTGVPVSNQHQETPV